MIIRFVTVHVSDGQTDRNAVATRALHIAVAWQKGMALRNVVEDMNNYRKIELTVNIASHLYCQFVSISGHMQTAACIHISCQSG